MRPGRLTVPDPVSGILNTYGLAENSGFVVMNLGTGEVLEQHNPTLERPPASVTKTLTALYAQAALGNDYRFETKVLATGPIRNGALQGNLVLVGGGDPSLNTDSLAELARRVAQTGLRSITGRFYVDGSALPSLERIDGDQPVQVGYNPGVSGLNLNYNRVYFEWKKRSNGRYRVSMDARSERYRPVVETAQMQISNRGAPTYTYASTRQVEQWTVARNALGNEGGRWLPVRNPTAYTAEVFRVLASSFGVALPAARPRTDATSGTVIASVQSDPLIEVERSMLRYSTNLTAEVLGMSATKASGSAVRNLRTSAQKMSRWVHQWAQDTSPNLYNHSGLTDRSRISAYEMASMLAQPRSRQGLAGLLKPAQMVNRRGDAVELPGINVFAKTGTLNFTRGLAGYIEQNGQQKLAFAIFTADMAARSAANPAEERPSGARRWSRAAKTQEKALLYRWATQYL